MKTLPNQTASESAPSKANSTLFNEESQSLPVLTAADQEILEIIGEVAGRYIAEHLRQRGALSGSAPAQDAI